MDNLVEFERHSEMAITQNGLIKFKRGKHEKDDRSHVSKKENYVLGWDNKEKIAVLRKELINLQSQQTENKKAITSKNAEIKNLGIFKDKCQDLFSKFDKYDDINWQSYASEIQEKSEQKDRLEKTNDRVKMLQEQLNKVQKDLKNLSEVVIANKGREIFQKEEQQKSINKTIQDNRAISEPFENIDVSTFEKQNSNLLNVEYTNLETSRRNFQDENLKKTRELS